MKTKCNAHKCWCGNREMVVDQTVRDNTDDLLLKVDNGGIYIATGGYTEHWASDSDFYQEYPVEAACRYPAVVEAVEREFPDGAEETLDGIKEIEILASTKNGGFVYFVRACEDFYVIEGETGTGIFCCDKESAELTWGGSWE